MKAICETIFSITVTANHIPLVRKRISLQQFEAALKRELKEKFSEASISIEWEDYFGIEALDDAGMQNTEACEDIKEIVGDIFGEFLG